MICANPLCLGVELKDDDVYCPWCGERVDLRMRVAEYVEAEDKWVPLTRFFKEERPQLRLEMDVSAKFRKVKIDKLKPATTEAEWLKIGPWKLSGGVFWAEITYLPENAADSEAARSENAVIAMEWPGCERRLYTELSVYPSPSLVMLDANQIDTPKRLLKDDNGEIHIPFAMKRYGNIPSPEAQVRLPQDLVKGKDAPAPNIVWLDGAAQMRGEIVYKFAGGDTPVCPVVLELRWWSRIGADAKRPLEFSQELPTYVQVIGSPKLVVLGAEGRTSWSVLTNRPSSYSMVVEVTNRGRDSKLRVQNVRLDNVPEGLQVELEGDLVNGGEIVNAANKVTTHALSLRLLTLPQVGNFCFNVTITWNNPVANNLDANWQQTQRLIGLRVGEPKSLPGSVLAVDFGTSSSCVAMWGMRALPEMITVDNDREYRAEDKCSLASVALFTSEHQAEIGAKACKLALQYPLAVLESPKRDICRRDDGFQVLPKDHDWTTVPVADAIELFYERLISCAQDDIVAAMGENKDDWNRINFDNLAVSHPSRFSFAQKKLLLDAATTAFHKVFSDTEVRLEMVQEPLAAALSYVSDSVVQREWHKRKDSDEISYSIVVYDCGGGTTDLCCLQVQSICKKIERIGITDFTQLSERQRVDLLPAAWKHLVPEASQEDIDAWSEAVKGNPDWFWMWDEDEKLSALPHGCEELIEAMLACANAGSEECSYTVKVCIKGASGDPTFGGTHITDEITGFLKERFNNLILGDQKSDDRKTKARRNAILLKRLAEALKCSLGCDSAVLEQRIDNELQGNTTLVTNEGNVSKEDIKAQVAAVSRVLYKRIRYGNGGSQTRIANLGDECLKLSRRCFGNDFPDVILLTGRGSQWRGVRESLEAKFPDIKEDIICLGGNAVKHCVARGAGVLALVKSGARLAEGPGVHIVDISEDVYTTCSLVLQCGTELVELIGAGCRFDEQGIISGRGKMWLGDSGNSIEVTVYQSDVPGSCQGNNQTMQREGVLTVGKFTIVIPEGRSGNAEYVLELHKSENPGKAFLNLRVEVDGERFEGKADNGESRLEFEVLNQ